MSDDAVTNDALVERTRLINAADAILAGTVLVPGSRRIKQISLFWPISEEHMAASSLNWLSTHTSTLNGTALRQWVKDPVASTETYKGTWRQVSLNLAKHGDSPGVMQVLRYGWLQETSEEEGKDDEVRFHSAKRDMCTGKLQLIRMWVNIDPEYLAKIEQSRKSIVTVINPQCEVLDPNSDQLIGQKVFTGRFAVSERSPDILQDQDPGQADATCSLIEVLQEVSLPTKLSELATITPEYPAYQNETRYLFFTATGDIEEIRMEYKFMDVLAKAYLMGEAGASLARLLTAQAVPAWANGINYTAGQKVSQSGNQYLCAKAHTAGTFAIDLTSGYWILLGACGATGDFPEWATDAVYSAGQKVTQNDIRYLCLLPHVAGTFATDLASGDWLALTDWTYSDRTWANQDDNTATFTVILKRARWNTGTTDADAIVVDQNAGLDYAQKSISRVWLRRTKAAFDTLVGVDGKAISSYTYQGVTYQHGSWRANELHHQIELGAYNIEQRLAIPKNSIITVHDDAASHLFQAREVLLCIETSTTWKRYCWQDFCQQCLSHLAAAQYADGSTKYYSQHGGEDPKQITDGYIRYLGSGLYEAHCVIIKEITDDEWPHTPPP